MPLWEQRAAALQPGPADPVAQQGRERPVRTGQRVQAHHLRGRAGRRSHHPKLQLLLRGVHLGGGHPVPLRQPQAPRDPDRDAGAGKFLQPELYPDRSAAWQGGLLRLLCRLRPAGAHRHRPARRAEKEPVLHRRPDGPGGAGLLCLWAEQQDLLSGNGGGSLRRGQRWKADAAYVVSEILAPDGSTIEQLAPVCKRQVLKQRPARPCGR